MHRIYQCSVCKSNNVDEVAYNGIETVDLECRNCTNKWTDTDTVGKWREGQQSQ